MNFAGEGADGLAALAGKPVRFHFTFGAAGGGSSSLFSFWVSNTQCGESSGYAAGGGPGIGGDTDTRGSCVTNA